MDAAPTTVANDVLLGIVQKLRSLRSDLSSFKKSQAALAEIESNALLLKGIAALLEKLKKCMISFILEMNNQLVTCLNGFQRR